MHSGTPYITHHTHIHTSMFGRDMVTSQPSCILYHPENATMLQLANVFTFRHVSIPLTLVSLYILEVICYIRKQHQFVELNSNIHDHSTQRKMYIHIQSHNTDLYRVSQEECARLRESVPYVKLYRYNPKHPYPKSNGYGDNGQRSLKL